MRNKSIMYILIAIFNLFDAIFTHMFIKLGLVKEINPCMSFLINISPTLFLIIKIGIVNILIYLVWKYRHKLSFSSASIGIAFVFYLVLVLYELGLAMLYINTIYINV